MAHFIFSPNWQITTHCVLISASVVRDENVNSVSSTFGHLFKDSFGTIWDEADRWHLGQLHCYFSPLFQQANRPILLFGRWEFSSSTYPFISSWCVTCNLLTGRSKLLSVLTMTLLILLLVFSNFWLSSTLSWKFYLFTLFSQWVTILKRLYCLHIHKIAVLWTR